MDLYRTLEQAVQNVDGWTPLEQLHSLATLVLATSDVEGDILEVGSWCGRSSIALGLGSKATNGCTVHCVDLFPNKSDWYENKDGTFSFGVQLNDNFITSYDEQTVWAEAFRDTVLPVYEKIDNLLEIFKSNIAAADVQDVMTTFRGELDSYLKLNEDQKYRLVFLDGDHSYNHVIEEIRSIQGLISSGGWLCFDDAFTSYTGVDAAITEGIINSEHFKNCHQITRKMFIAQKV